MDEQIFLSFVKRKFRENVKDEQTEAGFACVLAEEAGEAGEGQDSS